MLRPFSFKPFNGGYNEAILKISSGILTIEFGSEYILLSKYEELILNNEKSIN